MPKRTIGIFYGVSVLIEIVGIFIFSTSSADYITALQNDVEDGVILAQRGITIGIVVIVVGAIPGLVAWLGALINHSQAQQWIWFIPMFFFSGIMLLVHLIAGPQPLKKGQAPYSPGLS
jgi:hypothetical protein